MERFARIILGYHGAKTGAATEYARKLLLGEVSVDEWKPSENEFDWLGHGIYFWEHSPGEFRCPAAHNAVGLAGESPAVGIDCLST